MSAQHESTVKARPILFSAPMVRAILCGSKTQTRRAVREMDQHNLYEGVKIRCPYGHPGDRLWIQESHRLRGPIHATHTVECNYDADGEQHDQPITPDEWTKLMARKNQVLPDYGSIIPGRFMFRSLSRITLEIVSLRVERLKEISAADCRAEGHPTVWNISDDPRVHDDAAQDWYQDLWIKINGVESWDANPFVWVIKFAKLEIL